MGRYIVNLPRRDKIEIIIADADPVETADGDKIEWSEVEEHFLCDDCLNQIQNNFVPDGKEVIMVGIEDDTSGENTCEKCGRVATKRIKKFLR